MSYAVPHGRMRPPAEHETTRTSVSRAMNASRVGDVELTVAVAVDVRADPVPIGRTTVRNILIEHASIGGR